MLMDFLSNILMFFSKLWSSFNDYQKKEVIEGIVNFFSTIFADFFDESNKH